MKREIKFRGKRLDNGEWVVGSYIEAELNNGIAHEIIPYRRGEPVVEVDPDTVGEYTGIKDVNGVEIYEGDRVEYITDIINSIPFKDRGIVEYKSDIAMFILNVEVDTIPLSYCRRGIDVIGNIHDNPELLKIE